MTKETVEELAAKYIQKTERVFQQLKMNVDATEADAEKVKAVVDEAERYLQDAKYYLKRKRSVTSLASVTYCEGLLDALRMLEYVDFSW